MVILRIFVLVSELSVLYYTGVLRTCARWRAYPEHGARAESASGARPGGTVGLTGKRGERGGAQPIATRGVLTRRPPEKALLPT